jgi:hypothetical protein
MVQRYEKKCTTANFEGFFCIYQKKVVTLQAILRAKARERGKTNIGATSLHSKAVLLQRKSINTLYTAYGSTRK